MTRSSHSSSYNTGSERPSRGTTKHGSLNEITPRDSASTELWWSAHAAELELIHREIVGSFLSDLQGALKQPLRLEGMRLRLATDKPVDGDERHPPYVACATSIGMQGNVTWLCPAVTAAYFLQTLLGGGRYLPPPLTRPFTDIERGLLQRLADMLWKQIQTGWSTFAAVQLEPTPLSASSNPGWASLCHPPIVVVDWSISSPYARLNMHLAYGGADIRRLLGERSTNLATRDLSGCESARPLAPVCDGGVNTDSRWVPIRFDKKSAIPLGPGLEEPHAGDEIPSDGPADAPIPVFVDGELVGLGRLVRESGKLTVHVDNSATDSDGGDE